MWPVSTKLLTVSKHCSVGLPIGSCLASPTPTSPHVPMIPGCHTFVWGGQPEEGYDTYLQTNTGGGLISFTGVWTSDAAKTVDGNGKDYADFLLGYGNGQGSAFGNQTTGSLVISGPVSGKQTYRALYFGDKIGRASCRERV